MNKNDFVKEFHELDINIISNLYDKIILCEKSFNNIFTNEFYTPNIWSKLVEILPKKFEVKACAYGVFQDAERKLIEFYHNSVDEFPIVLLKIQNKSKFNTLFHKDYLGAILSLGIKRERIGDLLVKDNTAFVAVADEISEYIINSLTSIGKAPCFIEKVDLDNLENVPQYNFKELIIQCSSFRVDAIISAVCNLSRSSSETLIKEGKVLVNYIKVNDKNYQVNNFSTVTIRGYGKFRILEEIGVTQKNRKKIKVKKYI